MSSTKSGSRVTQENQVSLLPGTGHSGFWWATPAPSHHFSQEVHGFPPAVSQIFLCPSLVDYDVSKHYLLFFNPDGRFLSFVKFRKFQVIISSSKIFFTNFFPFLIWDAANTNIKYSLYVQWIYLIILHYLWFLWHCCYSFYSSICCDFNASLLFM